jgi:pimeloyl-ACP methyl ester carboxylesterase
VSVTSSLHWQQRVGSQREWVWRGWQTRYTYIRPAQLDPQSTPLILLHGFGASIGHWRHNLGALGLTHPVYALDMLGFGASEKAIARYNITLWVDQVYDFWRTFIKQPVVLVGNSIGSLVAIAAAAAHPDMVQGIVMMSLHDPGMRVEAIPVGLRPAIAAIENLVISPWLLKGLFKLVRRPGVVRKWAAIAYANPEAVTDELVEILTGPAQDRGSAQAFYALFKAMTSAQFGPSVKTVLSELQIPILLLWGKQDRMIPRRFVRPSQFVEYNPNLQLVELDNAGHCPHDECPEQVNQLILDWLKSWQTKQPDAAPLSLALRNGT